MASPAAFSKYDDKGLPSADAVYTLDQDAVTAIKTALMNHGAVAFAYYADQSLPGGDQSGDYFNYNNYCQYVDILDISTIQNHGVSIVDGMMIIPAQISKRESSRKATARGL